MWGQYNYGGSGFGADTVDETADVTEMSGADTVANQNSRSLFGGSPSHSLIALWFLALALYWGIGVFFRGQRQ